MSPENKQRAVGIVVLVAFIALLIPFLFTSGVKKKDQADSGSEAATSIPVNEVSASPPSAEMAASNLQPPLTTTTTNPTTPSKELPKEGIDTNVNAVADLPVAITEGVTENTPETATKVEPEPNIIPEDGKPKESKDLAMVPQKSVEKIKPVIKKPVVAKSNGKIHWSVQVGSFSDKQRMQRMVSKLQTSGFKVFLQKINTSHGLMIRVLVGREATQAKAEKISLQLKKKLKLTGRVVSNKK